MNAILPNLACATLRIQLNPEAPHKGATVRILAEPLPWSSLKDQPNRSSMRLRWRCFTEDGVLLVEETTHPFADGSAALLLNEHATPDAKVTLRHVGKPYDSFRPMKLEVIAARGIQRIFSRDRLRRHFYRGGLPADSF